MKISIFRVNFSLSTFNNYNLILSNRYYCANVNSTSSKCIELFSQPDGASATQSVVCKGGFKTGGDVCYSIKNVANTAGTANLTTPYSCTISAGLDYCNAFDNTGSAVTGTIPCLWGFTTSTTDGFWAWTGNSNSYDSYFKNLKEAILNSGDCHSAAFQWILDNNLLSSEYFTSTFVNTEGFGQW